MKMLSMKLAKWRENGNLTNEEKYYSARKLWPISALKENTILKKVAITNERNGVMLNNLIREINSLKR